MNTVPTPKQRLRDRIQEMEADATRREDVISTLADRAAIAEDALRRIGYTQGAVGLLARAALRACARTRGRDHSLTDLARAEPSPSVLGYTGVDTKVVEVCDPTADLDEYAGRAGDLLRDLLNRNACRCIYTAHCDGRKGCSLAAGGTVNEAGGVCPPKDGKDWPPVPR